MKAAPKNAVRYIGRIRNRAKREYAALYLQWICDGREGDSPDASNLTVMAAQAVRMQIGEMCHD